MLSLSNLKINNFLSVSKEISLSLKNRGVVGVFGKNEDTNASDSNGSGKSAVFSEALTWCLYGETLRGVASDDVVNNKVGKNCLVSLTIEEDMSNYEIIRTRKQAKAKKSNDLLVYLNGQNITKGTNQDTQELINSIIGMDFNTFSQSVLLSYGTVPFSQMTDKEKNEVFENILELDKLSKAKDAAAKVTLSSKNELNTLSIEVEKQKLYVNDLSIRKNKLKQASDEFDETKKRAIRDLVSSLSDLKANEEELKLSTDSLPEVVAELEKANKDLKEKQSAFGMFSIEISKVAASLVEQRAGVKAAIDALKRDIRAASATTSGVAAKVGGTCSQCLQVVTPGHADAILRQNEDYATEAEAQVVVLTNRLETIAQNIEELEIRKAETKEKFDAEIAELQALVMSLSKKELLVKRDIQDIKKLRIQIKEYENRIEEEKAVKNTFDDMYLEALMEHKKLSLELKELEDSASKIKEKIKYLSIVVDMLGNGGIKSRIIDGVLPFLQSKAQSYLDLLSDSKIRIEFSTTKELKKGGTKNELMVHAHNSQGSDAYYGNSAGEKQRIDLAIGWALGDLAAGRSSKKIRLKVCDEIFTHIDATGADAIFKLLNKAAEDYDSVFCITHDTNLQTQFNKTITVVKRGGSTYLSEESQ